MTSYIILIVVVIVLIVCIIAMLSVFMQRKVVETSSTNSDIIYSGAANHFLNGEGVGGGLYLTNGKILFRSHKLNIQNHELALNLADIAEVRFYNTLGLIPNGLEVITANGRVEKFVVYKRKIWKQQIEALKITMLD